MQIKSEDKKVHLKAIFIGVLMMPIHSYWISKIEGIVYKGGGASTDSLIWTTVYNMAILVVISYLIKRWGHKTFLNQADILAIFSMCNIAACVAGHDMVQILVPLITYPYWNATPENEWGQVLLPYLRNATIVSDRLTLSDYYTGESSLYNIRTLSYLLKPFLSWSGFIAVLLMVALSLNVLIHRKWTEVDRLSYPVVQLPLHLSAPNREFFSNKLVWLGIGTSGTIQMINNIHRIFPAFPYIRLYYELGQYFTDPPWNAVGWLPFNIIISYIGLGFFVPLDILFSFWFFLIVFKGQIILGRAIGFQSLPNFPYSYEQSSGGYIALGVIAIWITRKHLKNIIKMVFGKVDSDLKNEVTMYRIAIITLILGTFALVMFCSYLGMSAWVSISFFLLYYIILLAIARMRAEVGTPLHDLHFGGPSSILMNIFGSRRFTQSTLVGLAHLWFIDRAYRSNPMPHQLESLKLSERIHADRKGFIIALIVAGILAGPMAIWAMFNHCFEFGANNTAPVTIYFGYETWARFQSWINNLTLTNIQSVIFTIIGFLVTIGLMIGRMRFLWWQFNPIGYAISGSWQMIWGWGAFFIVWLIKLLIMKYSGIQGYRKATRYFLGLLLGEILVGGTWTMIGIGFNLW
ncbi:TPA: hypothetical protein ENX78_14915 [Candidatus Poribacteria bacterium]|nr:hypothetical protein [Candidatus Poribacteria bacterium]